MAPQPVTYPIQAFSDRPLYRAHLISPPEERVKAFLPERLLENDIDLIRYLKSNNKKLLDSEIGVRQCHCCGPHKNIHLVGYEETEQNKRENTKFLSIIGGRNGDSDKRHKFLFQTGNFECFSDYVCPTHLNRYAIERYNITTA